MTPVVPCGVTPVRGSGTRCPPLLRELRSWAGHKYHVISDDHTEVVLYHRHPGSVRRNPHLHLHLGATRLSPNGRTSWTPAKDSSTGAGPGLRTGCALPRPVARVIAAPAHAWAAGRRTGPPTR